MLINSHSGQNSNEVAACEVHVQVHSGRRSHLNEPSTEQGGFQLVDLIIKELKDHMTCYNSMPLIGGNCSIQTGEQIL